MEFAEPGIAVRYVFLCDEAVTVDVEQGIHDQLKERLLGLIVMSLKKRGQVRDVPKPVSAQVRVAHSRAVDKADPLPDFLHHLFFAQLSPLPDDRLDT